MVDKPKTDAYRNIIEPMGMLGRYIRNARIKEGVMDELGSVPDASWNESA